MATVTAPAASMPAAATIAMDLRMVSSSLSYLPIEKSVVGADNGAENWERSQLGCTQC
jgi:hypothetical protein